jgi:histidyl-tRNA synthetase
MIRAPKGFADILPAESWRWRVVEGVARQVSALYHFQEIRTPIVESTELFHRGVGETTDIVHKETFTFNDRGGESMTLRPEGTAGVTRAVIEGGLLNDEGARLKVFYFGPNFRYERPQKGRLRQHYQFGAEAFGVAEPEQDVECILLQMDFYRRCGLKDLQLQINSLGDAESKQRYREALVGFLSPRAGELSEDSRRRLGENPLRILDSKDPRDRKAVEGAPPAGDSLSDKSRAHFDRVLELLKGRADFQVNPNLVRGFDYYTETLWEVTAAGLGAQNAIGGGGRYDNLVAQLEGRPTPGVGFGSGIERLLIALEAQGVQLPRQERPLIWLISQGEGAKSANWELLAQLRAAGFAADFDPTGRSVKSQFKLADRQGAAYCLVVGEQELQNQTVVLKNLATGEQASVERGALLGRLREVQREP